MARFSLKRYLPRSLYGRAALILLVPIVTLQLVVSFAFIQRLYEDVTEQMTQNIAVEVDLLLDTVAAEGDVAKLSQLLQMQVKFPGTVARDQRRFYDLSGRVIVRTLRGRFENLLGVDLLENEKRVRMALQTDRGVLEIAFPRTRVSASNPHQLLVLMVVTGGFMTLIAYQFLRNQLRPIRRLAEASEAFGKGRHASYHPSGANEVRSAGTAFLSMRNRIERQIEQRTLMLSGVSHDLRTPLTRLKLGLSMQEQTPDILDLINDANEMERLIGAFLDFARADAVEDLEAVNLADMVRGVVEKAARGGMDVSLGEMPSEPAMMELRALAVQRALDNLIGNAVRYGTRARVSMDVLDTAVRLRVEDDGPGIPAHQREEALKPFARLDAARNQNKGSGVGLGLAIAADITRSHGGSLRLGDSDAMGGLRADIVLPR